MTSNDSSVFSDFRPIANPLGARDVVAEQRLGELSPPFAQNELPLDLQQLAEAKKVAAQAPPLAKAYPGDRTALVRSFFDTAMSWKPMSTFRNVVFAAPGLHLMYGPGGVGKTRHSLALQSWLLRRGVLAVHLPFMEPRGSRISFGSPITPEMRATGRIFEISYDEYLVQQLVKVRNAALVTGHPGVLIVDSLSYTLRALATTVTMRTTFGSTTFPGGVDSLDIHGCQEHSAMALAYDVVLIGTVNTDLMPTADRLHGSCEGEFTFGLNDLELIARDRQRGREPRSLQMDESDHDWADMRTGGSYGPLRRGARSSQFVGIEV